MITFIEVIFTIYTRCIQIACILQYLCSPPTSGQICTPYTPPTLFGKTHLIRSCYFTYHGEHGIGAVGARVDRGLGRCAGTHDHDFRHCTAATAAAGRLEIKPSDRGRQKIAVPPAVGSMLSPRWLRLRCIPRVTRAISQTATSGCRLAIPRAPLQQFGLRICACPSSSITQKSERFVKNSIIRRIDTKEKVFKEKPVSLYKIRFTGIYSS